VPTNRSGGRVSRLAPVNPQVADDFVQEEEDDYDVQRFDERPLANRSLGGASLFPSVAKLDGTRNGGVVRTSGADRPRSTLREEVGAFA